MIDTKFIKCIGCKSLVPDINGPTHPYIGASPGCWAIYGEILAREYGEFGLYQDIHRLTVDSYAVQHPGIPSRKSIQSVAVHLISLYLVLEKNFKGKKATKALNDVLKHNAQFVWLEPPEHVGKITAKDVLKAKNFEEHREIVQKWANSTWDSWSIHHGIIQKWAQSVLK